MTECRVILTESQGLTLGLALDAPWPMVVVAVVPRPLEGQVWVVCAWETDAPVPAAWRWQRGQRPTAYRDLAALQAAGQRAAGAAGGA